MNTWKKWLGGAAAMGVMLATLPAAAQTPIKFTLDWVFQGPTSPFLVALEKGYYKAEGLDVTMDPGQGSAGAVQRVATVAQRTGLVRRQRKRAAVAGERLGGQTQPVKRVAAIVAGFRIIRRQRLRRHRRRKNLPGRFIIEHRQAKLLDLAQALRPPRRFPRRLHRRQQ